MIAYIRVIALDSLAIPEDLDATYLWVFNDNGIWGSHLTDEMHNNAKQYELIRIARCGPKWGPGIFVDVIVKVMFGHKYCYIKQEGVYISRTD